jgi:hypothetical protein
MIKINLTEEVKKTNIALEKIDQGIKKYNKRYDKINFLLKIVFFMLIAALATCLFYII